MPHVCDACGKRFPDGSNEMLSGCPECGGTKFQFLSKRQLSEENEERQGDEIIDGEEGAPLSEINAEDDAQRSARTEIITGEDIEAGSSERPSDIAAGLQSPYNNTDNNDYEDSETNDGGTAEESFDETGINEEDVGPVTDIDTLRDHLDSEFESIKIIEPGEYELNLVKLFERQEHIIQIQEDGRYVIQMPERD